MARTPEKIAKDYLDDICTKAGFEPENIYSLIQTLEDDPDLNNVRLWSLTDRLKIRADYVGTEPVTSWEPDRHIELRDRGDEYAKQYFQKLGERTGIEFSDAQEGGDVGLSSKEKDVHYFTAQAYIQKGKKVPVVIEQTIIKDR